MASIDSRSWPPGYSHLEKKGLTNGQVLRTTVAIHGHPVGGGVDGLFSDHPVAPW